MNSNPKLSYAIAAILSSCAAASFTSRASAAAADTEVNSEAIQEVTVTAQRRTANAQNVTEGEVKAGYGITAGGDPNSNVNATLNLPLIQDKLSVRATIFTDHRGGYIDNVAGTNSFINVPNAGALKAYPGTPATQSPVALNTGLIGSNLNTATTTGARLSALFQFNDDWNLLLQQNYQNFEADGYFFDEPISPGHVALQ